MTNLVFLDALNAKDTEIKNKISDTTGISNTHEFNRFKKIKFSCKNETKTKSLASKT